MRLWIRYISLKLPAGFLSAICRTTYLQSFVHSRGIKTETVLVRGPFRAMMVGYLLYRSGEDPGGGGDWGDRPPKAYESNIFHHDFVQFRKTLGCQRRLDCQILLKSPPLNLRAGSDPATDKHLFTFRVVSHLKRKQSIYTAYSRL